VFIDLKKRDDESRSSAVSRTFPSTFAARAGALTLGTLLLIFLWYAVEFLLLLFAAVLRAIFLRSLDEWVRDDTPLSDSWALAFVTLSLFALLGLSGWLLAPSVARQAGQLRRRFRISRDIC
jgi:predicted PurR-regulated permease PerM